MMKYEFFQAKLPGKNWLKFGKNKVMMMMMISNKIMMISNKIKTFSYVVKNT